MGWRIIKQPNGKFARFSEVVDDFTHYNLTDTEAVYLCRYSYYMDLREAEVKVANAIANPDRFDEAINTIKLIHGRKMAVEREKELSGGTEAIKER